MHSKLYYFIIFICLLAGKAGAQEISFDKKSGEFSAAGKVIAKLEDEKVKKYWGKNFFVKDAAGTEILAYTLYRWDDTLGGGSTFYYAMRCTPLDLAGFRPNFTGMLNTFREVGELVVAKNLLLPDGKINEPAMRAYFAAANAETGDYLRTISLLQDSMIRLTMIPSAIPERDMRRPIVANEYGKIGQGNTVIGTWEVITNKPSGTPGASPTYHFVIKNPAGGIVGISWLEISGSHTYLFKNGVRSKDDWGTMVGAMDKKEAFAAGLAERCVKAGLL